MCEKYRLKNIINSLPKSNIKASDGNELGNFPFFTSSQEQNKFLDDFLFNEESLILGTGGSASIHYYNGKFSVSTDCLTLKINKELYLTKFVYYYLVSNQSVIDELGFEGVGIQHLQKEFLYNLKINKYGLEYQIKIINYLDNKLNDIDKNISKNKELISLLEEKKVALINQCVTKGLDDNVPMKDSGIDWIGIIPKEYEIVKSKRFCKLMTGGTPKKERLDYWDNGTINWMTSGEVNKQHIFDTKNKITQLGLNNSSAKMLPKQSVMMALSGQGKTKGTVATLEVPSCCSQSVAAFVCDKTKINYIFLYYYFKSIYKSIRGLVGDNKRDGLSLTIIGDIPLVLPSLSEQTEIIEYLNEEISKIEDITKKVQSQIELLEEYKQSLIYHVVTGKVDVRDVEV